MDINKVWLSGLVVKSPTLNKLKSRTPITDFVLRVREDFKTSQGKKDFHYNHFNIESLGRATEKVMDTVTKGSRYMIDGYLRQDTVGRNSEVKVRTYAVYPDDSNDNENYISGLAQALHILDTSMDLEQAKEKVAILLKGSQELK